jgi:hypothetical protein
VVVGSSPTVPDKFLTGGDMQLKFCSCRMCRYGRHRPYGKFLVRQTIRRGRRITKSLLKQGRYNELPDPISVPYTD